MPLLGEARGELGGAQRHLAVEERLNAYLERPRLAVLERDRETDERAVNLAGLREVHDGACWKPLVGEDRRRAVLAPRRCPRRRQRDRRGVAESGVEILDRED